VTKRRKSGSSGSKKGKNMLKKEPVKGRSVSWKKLHLQVLIRKASKERGHAHKERIFRKEKTAWAPSQRRKISLTILSQQIRGKDRDPQQVGEKGGEFAFGNRTGIATPRHLGLRFRLGGEKNPGVSRCSPSKREETEKTWRSILVRRQ